MIVRKIRKLVARGEMVSRPRACASSSSARRQFAVPTLEALLALPARRRRRRDAAGPSARPRPEDVRRAGQGARPSTAGVPVLQPARLKDAGVPRRAGCARRRPRRRRRLREDPDRRAAGDAAARHDQRARLAAARVPRRRAGASRGHRRRARDRRHDHAGREGARRRPDARVASRGRLAPTRPAPRSSATWRSVGAALLVATVDDLAAAVRHETPQDDSRGDLRAALTKEDGLIDWTLPGRAAAQPDPRPASLAPRLHVPRRPARDPPALGRGPDAPRPAAPGTIRRGRRRPLAVSRPAPARSTSCRSSRRASGRCRPASFSPATRSRAGDRFGPAMIAPARVAAYDVLHGRVRRRRRPPHRPRAGARRSRRRARPRAGSPTSPPACSAGARALDHVIDASSRDAPLDRLDPEIVEILRLERLSAPPPHARPRLGGRRRCGGADAASGQAQRRRVRQRGAPDHLAATGRSFRCRRGPTIRLTVTQRSITSAVTLVASPVAGGAVVRPPRLRRGRSVDALQQRAAPSDAARKPPARSIATI